MYKGIYHIRNSLWGVATVDVWSSSTRTFQQKNRSPEMINFFLYYIEKKSFSGSPKGTPHDWCRRTMKKDYFAMKTHRIRLCSAKKWWIFSLGTYILCMEFCKELGLFHVQGYISHNSLWRVATVDAWSSSTRTFQQKKPVSRNYQFFLYCI